MSDVSSVAQATDRVAAVSQRLERQRKARLWKLSAPALLMIGIFGLLPLCGIVVFSFLEPKNIGGVVWNFTTEAYQQFLFEKDLFDPTVITFTDSYLSIFGRSILLAFIAMVVCLLLGYPTAYFMATRPASQRNFWVFLITLPFWTNLLIRNYAILVILRDDGVINSILLSLGLIGKPEEGLTILYTDWAIGIGLIYTFLPFMVLPIYASLEKMDFRLVEAGYDLYASRRKVLTRILLPLSKPGIVAGCLLTFIPALGAYVTPLLLSGGKNLMIGSLIARQYSDARDWPFGSATALILLVMVMAALIYYVRNSQRQRLQHG